jgi:L-lactate permease
MPQLSDDDWGKVYLVIYCVVGLPIVWLHMRQQRMIESAKKSGQLHLVVYTLAVLWPLLLFAMLVNYLQPSPKSVKRNRPAEPPSDEKRRSL